MKNKYWIAIIGVVFVLCAALVFFPGKEAAAQSAQVVSEGKIIRILDLNEAQEFTVAVDGGYNTITVKDGKIAVTAADCPDQYCVRQGFCNSGAQIVCLPHALVISFLGESEIDGAVG
ncbi:MAG: NusG domain II-containing protein [Oscillospiraceae bacterium]|nr:NusG domain II-containing protein [Oscillospiraceae bacterium]